MQQMTGEAICIQDATCAGVFVNSLATCSRGRCHTGALAGLNRKRGNSVCTTPADPGESFCEHSCKLVQGLLPPGRKQVARHRRGPQAQLLRASPTWVQSVHSDVAVGRQPPGELIREQTVGQLALAISLPSLIAARFHEIRVLKSDATKLMRCRGDVHNAGCPADKGPPFSHTPACCLSHRMPQHSRDATAHMMIMCRSCACRQASGTPAQMLEEAAADRWAQRKRLSQAEVKAGHAACSTGASNGPQDMKQHAGEACLRSTSGCREGTRA